MIVRLHPPSNRRSAATRARALFAAAALATFSPACSLVFAPVIVDAGPDAYVPIDARPDDDVYAPDLPDAPDAYAPDAYVPERCDVPGDEDGDSLSDCSDPDCFGSESCCNPALGLDLAMDVLFRGGLPLEWRDQTLTRSAVLENDPVRLAVAGTAPFGALWRDYCVPLGQGGHIELRLLATPSDGESATIVLSPARAPGAGGFLSELALHIDHELRLTATRAGRAVPLDPAAPCVEPSGASAQLGPETTFFLDLVPGVAGGRSVLLARLGIQSSAGACMSTAALFEGQAILAEDLVRTPTDVNRSCQDSPGLYFGIEVRPGSGGSGGFALASLSGGPPSIVLRPLECASPGVFTRSTLVLDRESVDAAAAPHTTGGIGAPDLTYGGVSTGWALAYDASVEDRSEELFRRLSLSVGLGFASAHDFDRWGPSDTSPVAGLGARVREPSLVLAGVSDPVMLWARETVAPGSYEIARGVLDLRGTVGLGSTLIAPDALCESLREPTSALSYAGGSVTGEWVFARCDRDADSHLALWRRPSGGAPSMSSANVLGASAIAARVVAADVLSGRQGEQQFFALWVLVRGATDEAELHLFLADRVASGTAPTFVPYAGNPILREGDGSLPTCPAGDRCRLTSLSVAQVAMAGRDRLRFLFARSRTGGSAAYELVAAEQVALSGLDSP